MIKHRTLLPPLAAALAGLPLSSCISVKTPDKPIEINLNVNIKQEVLVHLQRDVEQLINQNPQAFPQRSRRSDVALRPCRNVDGARAARRLRRRPR